jgi:hypothetical protein
MTKISTLRKIWNTSKLCASDPNRTNRLAMDFVLQYLLPARCFLSLVVLGVR